MDAGSTTSHTRVVAGRYRLLDTVGSGGMGTVWRAEDQRLGRLVAVKEVRPPAGMSTYEYDDLRERTLREARAAARLSTTGAVAVHDVVEEDGRPYVVMELLDGRSLAAVLAEDGPLPPDEVARIGLSLVATLAAAHRAGILHRDVKPANVVLTRDGRVVLTDFGIAKSAGDPQLTSAGVLLGSPAYIAPERARGEETGPPSDLYALGATLFTAVEGRPPFAGDDAMATLLAVVAGRRQPMRAAGPLGPVMSRLLDPDPASRPTAAQAEQLLRAAHEQARAARTRAHPPVAPAATAPQPAQERTLVVAVPVESPAASAAESRRPAPQPPSPARRPRRARRRVPLLALLGLVAVLVLGAAALATRGTDPATPAAAPAGPGGTDEGRTAHGEGDATGGTGGSGDTAGTGPPAGAAPGDETEPAQDAPDGTGTAGPAPAVAAEDRAGDDPEAPAGWTTYTADAGWSLAHPEGWQPGVREVRGQRVLQVTGPGGGTYIRVSDDGRAEGDPVARWRAFAREFAARNASYEEVGITAVEDYRYTPAADWEFSYGSPSARLHVLDRMLFTADGRAYAVLVQGRDADEVRDLFDGVVESFRAPDG